MFMRELRGSSAPEQLKLLILQKGNKIANKGSGNFLHRGSPEPCAVLENPLKTVMLPLYHFPMDQKGRAEESKISNS